MREEWRAAGAACSASPARGDRRSAQFFTLMHTSEKEILQMEHGAGRRLHRDSELALVELMVAVGIDADHRVVGAADVLVVELDELTGRHVQRAEIDVIDTGLE